MTDRDRPIPTYSRLAAVFSRSWHGPALVLAAGLFLSGLVAVVLTKPDPRFDADLDRAEALITAEQYQDAIKRLNNDVFPSLDRATMTQDDRRRFHTLLARAIARGQDALGIDLQENHEAIVESYRQARQLHAPLTHSDQASLADSYVALGNFEAALQLAESMPPEAADQKFEIMRRVIAEKMNGTPTDEQAAATMLAEIAVQPSLPVNERAWVEARQAEIRLRRGGVDEAIDRLIQVLPKLAAADEFARGELFTLLADAYLQIDDLTEASKNLARADASFRGAHPLAAKVHLLNARLALRRGEPEDAEDHLALIIERFGETEWYIPALLDQGQVRAELDNHKQAIASYEIVAELIRTGQAGIRPTVDDVTLALLARFRERFSSGAFEQALRYAELAESLHAPGDAPSDVLLAVAKTCRKLAETNLPKTDDGRVTARVVATLDPAARRMVVSYFRRAGAYFREHADNVALTDEKQYARSLWLSADSFDRAGSLHEAIDAFTLFVDGFANDPREAEARFRLGRAHQSRADYTTAARFYRGLIDDRANRESGKGVGPFADASFVPLAQCYLQDEDPDNNEEAEQLLRRVLRGDFGGSQTQIFRDALVELGRLRYQGEEFQRAIERFEESLKRYAGDRESDEIRFLLADSYRQAAAQIDDQLDEALLDTERRELERAREQRLGRSIELFERVREAYAARGPRRLTPLEAMYLRNAFFYLGDCAFDLGDFTASIRHYDSAREAYPDDPSSLVAMIQIVNAHVSRGDLDRARTADERARRFFMSLPEEVWDDPNLPMSRQDWERWLDSSQRLRELERTG